MLVWKELAEFASRNSASREKLSSVFETVLSETVFGPFPITQRRKKRTIPPPGLVGVSVRLSGCLSGHLSGHLSVATGESLDSPERENHDEISKKMPEKCRNMSETSREHHERKSLGQLLWPPQKNFPDQWRIQKSYENQENIYLPPKSFLCGPHLFGKAKFCPGAGRCMLSFSQFIRKQFR